MPHAEGSADMSTPLTNGEKPASKVLSHITSYPFVSDTISTYKSNHYGQKTIDIANTAYAKFGSPLLPYLQTPYSYVAPYVQKADSLADSTLTKVDDKFPIVKEDTQKVKSTVLDLAFFPLRLAGSGKDYVFGTFNDEYKKTGGDDGIFKLAKATISTELKVGHDTVNYIIKYFNKGKEAAVEKKNQIAE